MNNYILCEHNASNKMLGGNIVEVVLVVSIKSCPETNKQKITEGKPQSANCNIY